MTGDGGVPDSRSVFPMSWPEHSSPSMNNAKDISAIIPQFDARAISSSSTSNERHSSPFMSSSPQQHDNNKCEDNEPVTADDEDDHNAIDTFAPLKNDPFKNDGAGLDDNDSAPFAKIPSITDNKGLSQENLPSFDAFGGKQ